MGASPNEYPRVAIVGGARTPFLRSGTDFTDLPAYELGRMAVAGLLHRSGIDPGRVERLVLGSVIQDPAVSNLGREVVFATDLPDDCPAYTVTEACISSLQSFQDALWSIQLGVAGVAIAAGAETLSDAPLRYRRPLRKRLIASQKARGPISYLKLLRGLRPGDLAPEAVAIAERTTRETMGQNCERLAKRLGVTREEQDALSLASHLNAAKAWDQGLLDEQVLPAWPQPRYQPVRRDNGIRGDTTLEKLATLKPAFDRRFGTLTAGNSSFLTDGGAAVLLTREDLLPELGLEPLAIVRGVATVAMDPWEELLLGPALAIPKVLEQAGLELDQIEVVELHEAFAAQVVAVLKLLADDAFARERLGRDRAVGEIFRERLNGWGGSLSIGHPFGATGARLLMNCAYRMRSEGARYGLVAACAAGALGIAVLLERPS
ncbi:MAG TPA: acetyl-CoA C-acyltransferase [Planctomycetota bacterium]